MKSESNPNEPTPAGPQPVSSGPPSGRLVDIYPPSSNAPSGPADSQQQTADHPAPGPPDPPKNHPKTSKSWHSAVSTILLFLLAPLIALSITAFAFQSYQVDGQSMETTLQNNDRLIVDKIPRSLARITHHPYIPKRGDIIIFNQAGLFNIVGAQEKQLIKRVIGLPGDRVVVKDGAITIYNAAHPGGFNPDKTGLYRISAPMTPGNSDYSLKSDEIFVCGDNRGNSEDSRIFGPVNVSQIVGKLSFRIFPLDKARRF